MSHVGTPGLDELPVKNVAFLRAGANGGAFKSVYLQKSKPRGVGGGHNKLFVREKARCIF